MKAYIKQTRRPYVEVWDFHSNNPSLSKFDTIEYYYNIEPTKKRREFTLSFFYKRISAGGNMCINAKICSKISIRVFKEEELDNVALLLQFSVGDLHYFFTEHAKKTIGVHFSQIYDMPPEALWFHKLNDIIPETLRKISPNQVKMGR